MTSSVQLQLRRGAASDLTGFTGAQGEPIYDETGRRLLMMDGQTAGGIPVNGVYAPNGSLLQPNVLEGAVETLSVGGTTYSTTLQIPAGCLLIGVSLRVRSAITGATAFELGTAATPNQFATGLSTAAGASEAALIAPAVFAAATPLLLTSTAGGNFTGGTIRAALHYFTIGAPTS